MNEFKLEIIFQSSKDNSAHNRLFENKLIFVRPDKLAAIVKKDKGFLGEFLRSKYNKNNKFRGLIDGAEE